MSPTSLKRRQWIEYVNSLLLREHLTYCYRNATRKFELVWHGWLDILGLFSPSSTTTSYEQAPFFSSLYNVFSLVLPIQYAVIILGGILPYNPTCCLLGYTLMMLTGLHLNICTVMFCFSICITLCMLIFIKRVWN